MTAWCCDTTYVILAEQQHTELQMNLIDNRSIEASNAGKMKEKTTCLQVR